jgi:hypothetical protein
MHVYMQSEDGQGVPGMGRGGAGKNWERGEKRGGGWRGKRDSDFS